MPPRRHLRFTGRTPAGGILWGRVLSGWITVALVVGTVGLAQGPDPVMHRQPVAAIAPTTTTSTVAPPSTTTPPTTTPPTTTPVTTPPPPPPPPPTTTTVPRRTTTTRVVAPRVTATAAPAGTDPAATPTPEYAAHLLKQVVPAAWLAAVPVDFEVIPGQTSWSDWGGLIQVGDWQLTSSVGRARFTVTHEWGHQLAFLFGTDAFNGAGPAGFPYDGPSPEEMWADCVAQALTGTYYTTAGLPPCPADALGFTAHYLAVGPGTPLRTRPSA